MKKKIKDLTFKECKSICVKAKDCDKCPFKKYYGRNPCLEIETLTKAPQNFCYVEEE